MTVTRAMALFPSALAAMSACPGAIPRTTPWVVTVAMRVSLDAQNICLPCCGRPAVSSANAVIETAFPT